jgi:hypothetical protein
MERLELLGRLRVHVTVRMQTAGPTPVGAPEVADLRIGGDTKQLAGAPQRTHPAWLLAS